MGKSVVFDHIEVHVNDISRYCSFLKKVFGGGRLKVLGEDGASMFKTTGGLNIEVKKKGKNKKVTDAGFCRLGLRIKGAKKFIENTLGLKVTKSVDNPDGKCCFFKDHEGITWHVKDYSFEDRFIDW